MTECETRKQRDVIAK